MAPAAMAARSPLAWAMRMEKEVSGISSGVSRDTSSKAWLSVMTIRGGTLSFSSVCGRSVAWQTTALAWASSTSRSTCCWGRIIRPLGAAASMGITSTTRSPGDSRSPTRRGVSSRGTASTIACFRASIPSPVRALTKTPAPSRCVVRSHLFRTSTQGMLRLFSCSSSASSVASSGSAALVTSTARSVLRITCMLLCTRWLPSSPVSSSPAVSIISTGPRGSSSIALLTGSVVVPGVSDTMAMGWLVTAFMRLDFPALRLPKKAICSRSADGVSFRLISIPPIQRGALRDTQHALVLFLLDQNRKSRLPFLILSRFSRTICCTFWLGILGISFSINALPTSLVWGDA